MRDESYIFDPKTNPVKNKLIIVYHIQFIASGNIGTVRKMNLLKLKLKVLLVLLVVTTFGNIYAHTEVWKHSAIAFYLVMS